MLKIYVYLECHDKDMYIVYVINYKLVVVVHKYRKVIVFYSN